MFENFNRSDTRIEHTEKSVYTFFLKSLLENFLTDFSRRTPLGEYEISVDETSDNNTIKLMIGLPDHTTLENKKQLFDYLQESLPEIGNSEAMRTEMNLGDKTLVFLCDAAASSVIVKIIT